MQKYSLGISFCYFFERIYQRNCEMIKIITKLNPQQKFSNGCYYKNGYFLSNGVKSPSNFLSSQMPSNFSAFTKVIFGNNFKWDTTTYSQ